MKKLLSIFICLLLLPVLFYGQDTLTKKEIRKQKKNFLLQDRPWTIEVPLWIPGFAGSFAYGDINVEGEDGEEIENPIEPPPGFDFGDLFSRLFSTSWYLKFFFLTRIAYESERFIGQFDAFAGAVGQSTEFNYNQKEIVQVNFRSINTRLFGGYKIVNTTSPRGKFRYELIGYIGIRAHFNKVSSDLNNAVNKLDFRPVWFEPIIGIQNQFTWKKWFLVVQGDYGGYFVDTKYSFQGSTYIYFRSGKITSLKLGWSHLELHHRGTFRNENYKIDASFSGPAVGIAFHF